MLWKEAVIHLGKLQEDYYVFINQPQSGEMGERPISVSEAVKQFDENLKALQEIISPTKGGGADGYNATADCLWEAIKRFDPTAR